MHQAPFLVVVMSSALLVHFRVTHGHKGPFIRTLRSKWEMGVDCRMQHSFGLEGMTQSIYATKSMMKNRMLHFQTSDYSSGVVSRNDSVKLCERGRARHFEKMENSWPNLFMPTIVENKYQSYRKALSYSTKKPWCGLDQSEISIVRNFFISPTKRKN